MQFLEVSLYPIRTSSRCLPRSSAGASLLVEAKSHRKKSRAYWYGDLYSKRGVCCLICLVDTDAVLD